MRELYELSPQTTETAVLTQRRFVSVNWMSVFWPTSVGHYRCAVLTDRQFFGSRAGNFLPCAQPNVDRGAASTLNLKSTFTRDFGDTYMYLIYIAFN